MRSKINFYMGFEEPELGSQVAEKEYKVTYSRRGRGRETSEAYIVIGQSGDNNNSKWPDSQG